MNQLRRRRPEAALSNTFYALVDIQLVKEIQCLVSVASLEVLCAAQKVERRADIECELFQLYHCRGTVGRGHGDNDESTSKKEALDMSLSNDSMVAKFFEGRDQFAAATTVEWIHNDGNSNNTKLKRRCLAPGLVQKLQCTGTGIVLDNTFTTASHEKTLPLFLLRSKSFYKHKSAATMTTKDLISGSIVYNLANQAIAMCREAVHMGADFLINGQLPENQTRHDYFQHVLNKMYQTYGPGQSKSAPEGWYFKGWMAFYLFGPMAEPAHQCRLIMSRVPLLSRTFSAFGEFGSSVGFFSLF